MKKKTVTARPARMPRVLAPLLGFFIAAAAGDAAQWTGTSDWNWLQGSNWQGGVAPNTAGAVATFNTTAITALIGKTISVNPGATVGQLEVIGASAYSPTNTLVIGTGSQTLTFDNSGVAVISLSNSLNLTIAANIMSTAGALTVTNSSTSLGKINITGTLNAGSNAVTFTNDDATAFTTVSGKLTAGSLAKQGAGKLILSGAGNAITGDVTFDNGTIIVGANNVLGTGAIRLVAGADTKVKRLNLADDASRTLSNALDISQGDLYVGREDAASASVLRTLTVNPSGATTTSIGTGVRKVTVDGFTGLTLGANHALNGTGTLTKYGTGVLTLLSNNSSFGALDVRQGTVVGNISSNTTIGGGTGIFGNGVISVNDGNAILEITSDNIANVATIGAGANITINNGLFRLSNATLSLSGGTITVSGTGLLDYQGNVILGSTTINNTSANGLSLGGNVTFTANTGIVDSTALRLDLSGSGAQTLFADGVASVTIKGTLAKTGTGRAVIDSSLGALNLDNALLLNAGTLDLASSTLVANGGVSFGNGDLAFGKVDQMTGGLTFAASSTGAALLNGYSQTSFTGVTIQSGAVGRINLGGDANIATTLHLGTLNFADSTGILGIFGYQFGTSADVVTVSNAPSLSQLTNQIWFNGYNKGATYSSGELKAPVKGDGSPDFLQVYWTGGANTLDTSNYLNWQTGDGTVHALALPNAPGVEVTFGNLGGTLGGKTITGSAFGSTWTLGGMTIANTTSSTFTITSGTSTLVFDSGVEGKNAFINVTTSNWNTLTGNIRLDSNLEIIGNAALYFGANISGSKDIILNRSSSLVENRFSGTSTNWTGNIIVKNGYISRQNTNSWGDASSASLLDGSTNAITFEGGGIRGMANNNKITVNNRIFVKNNFTASNTTFGWNGDILLDAGTLANYTITTSESVVSPVNTPISVTFSANTNLIGDAGLTVAGSYGLELLSGKNTFSGGLTATGKLYTTLGSDGLTIGQLDTGKNYLGTGDITVSGGGGSLTVYTQGYDTVIGGVSGTPVTVGIGGSAAAYVLFANGGSVILGQHSVVKATTNVDATFRVSGNLVFDGGILGDDGVTAVQNVSLYFDTATNSTGQSTVSKGMNGSSDIKGVRNIYKAGAGETALASDLAFKLSGSVYLYGGVLKLTANNQITLASNSATNLVISGGALDLDSTTQSFNTLYLRGSGGSVLLGGSGQLTVATRATGEANWASTALLSIQNTSGVWTTDGMGAFLRFSSNPNLTASELGNIALTGYESGTAVTANGGFWYLTPTGIATLEWNGGAGLADSKWGTASNWLSGSVPNGLDTSVSIKDIDTDLTQKTINVDGDYTLTRFNISSAQASVALNGAGTLIFDRNTAAARLAHEGGSILTLANKVQLNTDVEVFTAVPTTSGYLNWTGAISGTGAITKTGAGTLLLYGNNTFAGGFNWNDASTIQLGGAAAAAAGSNYFGTGTLTIGTGSITDTYVIETYNAQLAAGSATSTSTTRNIASNFVLRGNLSFLQQTNLGTVVSNDSTTPASLYFSGDGVFGTAADSGKTFTLNTYRTYSNSGAYIRLFFQGDISGYANIKQTGYGLVYYYGDNSNFSGDYELNAGNVYMAKDKVFGTGKLTVSSGGTASYIGTTSSTITVSLPNAIDFTGNRLNFNGSTKILFDSDSSGANGNSTVSSTTFDMGGGDGNTVITFGKDHVITGPGGFRFGVASSYSWGGQMRFLGENTFSGGMTMNSGTVLAGRDSVVLGGIPQSGAWGTGTITFTGGAAIIGAYSEDTNKTSITVSNAFNLGANTINVTNYGTADTLVLDTATIALRNGKSDLSINVTTAGQVFAIESQLVDASVSTAGGITKIGAGTLQLDNTANVISAGIEAQSGTVRITPMGDLTLDSGAASGFGVGTLLTQTATGAGTAGAFEIAASANATITLDGSGNKIILNDYGRMKVSGTNVTTVLKAGGSLISTDTVGQEGLITADKLEATNFSLGVKVDTGATGTFTLNNAGGGTGVRLTRDNLFGSATNITIGTGGKLDINKTSQNLSTARIHVTGAGTIDVNSTGFAAYNPLILTVGEIAVDTGGLLTFANWAGDKDTGLGSTRIVTTLAPGTVIEGVKFGLVDSAYAIAYRNTDSQVVLIPFDALFVWKGQTSADTWTADNWMLEAGTPITGKYADQSSARVIFDSDRTELVNLGGTITIKDTDVSLGSLIFQGAAQKDFTIDGQAKSGGGKRAIILNSGSLGSTTATTIRNDGVSNIAINSEIKEYHTGNDGETGSGTLNIIQNGSGTLAFGGKITGYEMTVNVTGTGTGAVIFNGANSVPKEIILDYTKVYIGTDNLLGLSGGVLTLKSGTIRGTDGTAANADADRTLANRYNIAGDVTIDGTKKLTLTENGGVSTNATLTVTNAAAEIVLGSAGKKLGVINGDNVNAFTNTLTIAGAGKATIAADIVAGAGALVLTNAQTTLGGGNAYTGGTTIGDGVGTTVINVTNAAGLGTGLADIKTGSTLNFTSAVTSGTNAAALANAGTLAIASSGATYTGAITNNTGATFNLTGANNTVSGALTNNSTVTVSDTGNTLGAITNNTGANLTIATTATGTVLNNAITNTGTITVGAATTLTAAGSITNNNVLNLNAVLTTAGATPITGTGTLNVNAGATGQTLSGVTNGTINIAATNVTLSGTNTASTLWDIKTGATATANAVAAIGGTNINVAGTLNLTPVPAGSANFTAKLTGAGTVNTDLGALANTLAFTNATNASASTFNGAFNLARGTLTFDANAGNVLGSTNTTLGNGTTGSALANITATNTTKLTGLTLNGAGLNVATTGAILQAQNITIGAGGATINVATTTGQLLATTTGTTKHTTAVAYSDNAVGGSGALTYAGAATATLDITQSAITVAKATYANAATKVSGTQNGLFLEQTLTALNIVAGQTLDLNPATMGGSYMNVAIGETGPAGNLKVSAGAGTLYLTQANTYTGTTQVVSGTLSLSAANAIAPSSAVTVASGATLVSSAAQQLNNLTGAGTVTLGAALTANNTAATTYSGALTANNFTKTGAGALTLSGATNNLGAVTVSAGQLNAAHTGALGAGAITIASGATLTYTSALTGGSITNTLTNSGTTTLASSGATYSGAITNTGTLTITGNTNTVSSSIGGAGTITLSSNTNNLTGGINGATAVTVTGNTNTVGASSLGTLTLSGSGNTLGALTATGNITVSGATNTFAAIATGVSSTKIDVTATATGTTFNGALSGAAQVDIAATGVQLNSTASTAFTGNWAIKTGATATAAAAANSQSVFGTGTIALAGTANLSSASALTVSNTLTGAGTLSATAGAATDTFVLTGNTAAYTGTVDLQRGTIALNGSSNNNLAAATLKLRAAATADLTAATTLGTLDLAAGTVKIAMNGTDPLYTYTAGTITITDTASTLKADGLVTGPGSVANPSPANYMDIALTGDEILLVAGATDGIKQINLVDGNGTALTGDRTVTDAAGVKATYGFTALTPGKTLGGKTDGLYMDYQLKSLEVQGGKTLALDGTAGDGGKTLAAEIFGAGNVTLTGGTTATPVILSHGNDSFTGTMTVLAGATAQSANANAFGTGTVALQAGSTLNLASNNQTLQTLGDVATSTVKLGGATLTLQANSNTLAGIYDLNGGHLVLNGAGTTVTTGSLKDNGITNTRITFGGTAQVTAANTGLTTNTTVTNTAALTLTHINALGTAAIVNNSTLTLSNVTGTLNNVVSGTGQLLVNTAGNTVALNHANTYTGGTALQAGALTVGHNGALGTGGLTLASGTTLNYAATIALANAITLGGDATLNVTTGTATQTGSITGANGLTKTGAGTLILTAANTTYTGATAITAGTLVAAHNDALGTGAVTNTAVLEIADGATVTSFANAITNTGGVVNVKADNLTLSGAITAGTVNFVGSTAAITGANTGVAWNIDGTSVATYTGKTALGSGAVTVQDAGQATLNDIGVLALDNALALAGTGAFTLNTTGDTQVTGALTGNGVFNVDLGATANQLTFATSAGEAFTGTLKLSNATYDLAAANNLGALGNAMLELSTGAIAKLETHCASGNLSFTGGLLDVGMISANECHIFTVGDLDVDNCPTPGAPGTVNLQIASLNPGTITGSNFLDQDDIDVIDGIQVVKATNTVSSEGKQLELTLDGASSTGNDQTHIVGDGHGNTDVKATYGYMAVTTKGEHLAGGAGLYVDYVLKTLETQTNLVLDTTGANKTTLGAQLTGAGNLELRANAGTLTLNNASNDYTGATTITSGTVIAGSDNALGQTSGLTLVSGTAFDLNGKNQTVGTLDLAANATTTLNGGTLTVDGLLTSAGVTNLGTGTLKLNGGGTINGDGALVGEIGSTLHIDPSDLVISGANAGFHGATLIDQGSSITLDHVQGLGDGLVTLNGNAADNAGTNGQADLLRLALTNTANAGTLANALAGNGTLQVDAVPGAEIQILRANTGFTGLAEIQSGTLQVSHVDGIGTSALTIGTGSGAGAVYAWTGIVEDTQPIANTTTVESDGTLLFDRVSGTMTTDADGQSVLNPAQVTSAITGAGTVAFDSSTVELSGQNSAASQELTASHVLLAAVNTLGTASSRVSLDDQSLLTLGVDGIVLGNVTNHGQLAFARPAADADPFKTATLSSLAGDGHLTFNVNFVTLTADHLAILGDVTGRQTVHITQVGDNPTTGEGKVELIHTDNTVAARDAFQLPTNLAGKQTVDVGIYAYTLRQGDGSEKLPDPHSWYLVGDSLSKMAEAIVGSAAGMGLGWHAEMDSLVKRMGDLRLSQRYGAPGCGAGMQAWVRGYGWETNVNDKVSGSPFKEYYYGSDVGMDKTYRLGDGYLSAGLFVGGGRAKRQFNGFGDGHTDSYRGGVYLAYLDDTGWYADLVAKANYYETDFDSTSTYGDKTSADYDQWAGGVSLEIGKQLVSAKGWFAEPQFQFSYGRIQGQDYTAKGPIPVDVALEKQDSFQVRGGVRFGKNIATTLGTLQPYAKASAAGMWTDGGHVRTEDGLSRRATLDGGRVELGAGLVWETNGAGQIYLDYEYVRAERFEIPWKLNAGYRIQW